MRERNTNPADACATPVLFLIYRRPEVTRRVFEAIRKARPRQLWIAADGAKAGSAAEAVLCEETRALVMKGIDWPCDVRTRFAEVNLGCKQAVAQAIDWAFGECDRLIIVEDDCLPNADFFRFCEEMLERHANEPKVMQVCGSNLLVRQQGEDSYYFSRFGPIWGWATWRRAWDFYDVEMASWPETKAGGALKALCPEPYEAEWRREIFDDVHEGRIDTWDYQWAYAKLVAEGLSIIPARHLVVNIGFGADATHTHAADDPRGKVEASPLTWPLRHPESLSAWTEADRAYLREVVGLPAAQWGLRAMRYRLRRMVVALKKAAGI